MVVVSSSGRETVAYEMVKPAGGALRGFESLLLTSLLDFKSCRKCLFWEHVLIT